MWWAGGMCLLLSLNVKHSFFLRVNCLSSSFRANLESLDPEEPLWVVLLSHLKYFINDMSSQCISLPIGSWAGRASCKCFIYFIHQSVPQDAEHVQCLNIKPMTRGFAQGPPGPGGLPGELGKAGPPVSKIYQRRLQADVATRVKVCKR